MWPCYGVPKEEVPCTQWYTCHNVTTLFKKNTNKARFIQDTFFWLKKCTTLFKRTETETRLRIVSIFFDKNLLNILLYDAAHIIAVDQNAFSQLFSHNMHGTYIVHTQYMKEHPQMWDAHHYTFLHVRNSKQKQIPWENYLPKKATTGGSSEAQ